jgi:hypothetical protein
MIIWDVEGKNGIDEKGNEYVRGVISILCKTSEGYIGRGETPKNAYRAARQNNTLSVLIPETWGPEELKYWVSRVHSLGMCDFVLAL